MVRSEICFNNLNPRWMPWSARAFCFRVWHPSSLLFFSIFDYDRYTDHDPVGRVCINTAKFRSGVSYLLHYPLQHMPTSEKRGTAIIRVRVEWRDESDAVKKSCSTVPPRFLINVDNEHSLKVLRYTCRGAINMDDPTMKTTTMWFNELYSYGTVYFYIIDVIFNILLWRGRATICGISIWFPLRSIVTFVFAIAAIERPRHIPALFFYGLGWILLTMNYHWSRHPNPWQRCKSLGEMSNTMLFGNVLDKEVKIQPFEGVEETKKLEDLDALKAQRISAAFWDTIRVGLNIRRIYNKTDVNCELLSLKTL